MSWPTRSRLWPSRSKGFRRAKVDPGGRGLLPSACATRSSGAALFFSADSRPVEIGSAIAEAPAAGAGGPPGEGRRAARRDPGWYASLGSSADPLRPRRLLRPPPSIDTGASDFRGCSGGGRHSSCDVGSCRKAGTGRRRARAWSARLGKLYLGQFYPNRSRVRFAAELAENPILRMPWSPESPD